jgi:ubiquinone biosynthesis protein UbiJ
MAEVEINGTQYRVGRLTAFKKLHVARKLAPLLGGLAAITASGGATDIATFAQPIAQALANMSDDEVEGIIGTCMAVTERRLANDMGWAPVWNKSANRMQYEDMDLPELMQLTMAVLEENLGSFLPANPDSSPAPAIPKE